MRKFKYILSIIVLSIVVKHNYAQNLVPNPSFEIYSSCPTTFSQTSLAAPWYDPTAGSSDYFNACAVGYANVPFCSNGNTYQFARTGNAFTGLYALNGLGNLNREYIQVQLSSPLVHDSCYLIEFYCNLFNNMGYSINKLGSYLSDTALHYTALGSILNYTPQIVSTVFLTDTLNWMRIAGYYHAVGGEQFLTVGDFKPFTAGDTLNTGVSGGYDGAYYFIDDVSITKVAGCDTAMGINENIDNLSFKIFPNPNNGNMTIKYTLRQSDKGSIRIYDVTGKLIEENSLNSNDNQMQITSTLDLGIYLYQIIVNDRIVKSDKMVIIK